MADYIERQAAVDMLKEIATRYDDPSAQRCDYNDAAREVQRLPAAKVREDVQGKATHVSEDNPCCLYGYCSICGSYIPAWNFCPNCGARMETSPT